MAITTPDAVPGEVIEAAWGDAVRADLTTLDNGKVAKAGDTMSGQLQLPAGGTATSAARRDYVDGLAANRVLKAGDVMTGNLRWGNDPATGTGAMIRNDGAIVSGFFADDSSHTTLSSNMSLVRSKTPVSDATAPFILFRRSGGAPGSAVTIGSITIDTGGAAVKYLTTSDKRLKTMTRLVDPIEALVKVNAFEPVNFLWTSAPEAGERTGFFAQDLVAYAPEAVSEGHGEPGDEEFMPWMVDNSTLVPTLVAAIQALTRRIEQLEGTA